MISAIYLSALLLSQVQLQLPRRPGSSVNGLFGNISIATKDLKSLIDYCDQSPSTSNWVMEKNTDLSYPGHTL